MEEKYEHICPLQSSVSCDALKGAVVLEMAEYVAAPVCGRMLADYGATVIKIEKGSGDPWRIVGHNTKVKTREDRNPLFDILNSKKKSIQLNLKDPDDKEIFHRLLLKADIFLTNIRMQSLRKLEIDPDCLMQKHPGLIYGLMTGFGIEGSEKDLPGFDPVAFWARSGAMLDTQFEENQYPLAPMTAIGDTIAGVMLLTGLLAALIKKQRTGKGDFVTSSLLGASIWSNNHMVMMTDPVYGDHYPVRRSESNPQTNCYLCADGRWISIGIMLRERHIPKLMDLLGVPEMKKDPRFRNGSMPQQYWDEIRQVFEHQFLLKSSDEWLKLLNEADIACGKLVHFSEVSSDQQAWENGNLETFRMRNGETCTMPCPPVRFGSTGIMKSACAPYLDENRAEILHMIESDA